MGKKKDSVPGRQGFHPMHTVCNMRGKPSRWLNYRPFRPRL